MYKYKVITENYEIEFVELSEAISQVLILCDRGKECDIINNMTGEVILSSNKCMHYVAGTVKEIY